MSEVLNTENTVSETNSDLTLKKDKIQEYYHKLIKAEKSSAEKSSSKISEKTKKTAAAALSCVVLAEIGIIVYILMTEYFSFTSSISAAAAYGSAVVLAAAFVTGAHFLKL